MAPARYLDAGIDELLLERGEQRSAGRRPSAPPPRGAGNRAGSTPRRAVGGHHVAEIEALGGAPSPNSTLTLVLGSGTRIMSPSVPNGVAVIGPNGDIMMLVGTQPTPDFDARGEIARRKPLAAHEPGHIAGADHDERFAMHGLCPKAETQKLSLSMPGGAAVKGTGHAPSLMAGAIACASSRRARYLRA